ncbi:MAG: WD40/YVTN/BNR-like repeat-containing protein [Solirubrobacteraceae bacterium]
MNGTPVGDQPNLAGRVSAVAIVPGSPPTEVIGTLGGIWKRTGTHPWRDVTRSSWPATAVNSLAVDPLHRHILYAGTGWDDVDQSGVQPGDGVLKSVDGGQTWTPLAASESLMHGFAVTGLAVDPKNDRIVVAAANNGLFRSTNGGRTWKSVLALGVGPYDVASVHLAVDRVTGVMLAGVAQRPGLVAHRGSATVTTGHAMYRSADGGQTWSAYAVDPSLGDGDTLVPAIGTTTGAHRVTYAYALDITGDNHAGMYTSTDGRRWTYRTHENVTQKFTIAQMVLDPDRPSVAYYGHEFGPYSYAFGSTHTRLLSSVDSSRCSFGDFRAVAFGHSITHPAHLAVYGGQDGGTCYFDLKTRKYVNNNPGLISGIDYDVSALSAKFALIGAQDLGVDQFNGRSSSREIYHADGYGVLIDRLHPAHYYAGVNPPQVFVTSSNRGLAWHNVTLHPQPTNVYSPTLRLVQATGDGHMLILPVSSGVVYVSSDDGATWKTRSLPLGADRLTSIRAGVFPGSAVPVIYVGTQFGRLWRSTDRGAHWTELAMNFGPLSVDDIALDRVGSGPSGDHLYVGLGVFAVQAYHTYPKAGDAWESHDSGASWTNIGQQLQNTSVNVLLLSGSTLLAGTDFGVQKYSGGHWAPAGTGLPNVRVSDLVLSADGKAFFAATYGRGTWRSP